MATQVPEPNSLKGRKRLQNPSRYQLPHPAHVAMLILAMAIGLSYFGKDQGAVLKASPNTKVTERDQEFKGDYGIHARFTLPLRIFYRTLFRTIFAYYDFISVVEVMLNGEEDTGAKAVLVQKESMKTLEALQRKLGSVLEHCEDGSCKIFTPLGQEITEPMQIQGPERLFILVPEGRLFMWPGFHIGYRVRRIFFVRMVNRNSPNPRR